MEFSSPFLTLTGIKAARGLTGGAYEARDDLFVFDVSSVLQGIALFEGVPIVAGQETPVPVDLGSDLSPHANIRKITATFRVINDGGAGATQTTSATVSEGNDPPRSLQVSVDNIPGMRNVQIRLNQGTVIWTHPGAVPATDYPIPDFSAQANAYLDKYQSKDGKVIMVFLVKSDTNGKVQITVDKPDSTVLQTQSWKNEVDSTFRADRTLKLTFNQIESLPVDPVPATAGHLASMKDIRLDAVGQFAPDRILGNIEVADGSQFATVSQDFSLAQQITPFPGGSAGVFRDLAKTTVQCSGIACYVEGDANAEFYVELQSDKDSSPSNGSPLAKSNVSFTSAGKSGPQPWTFAKFEKPAELKPDTPYWIVVKGVQGELRLGLNATDTSPATIPPVQRNLLLLNRGGQIWKEFARIPLQALLSVIYVPQPDNQAAALEILAGANGGSKQVDPHTAPQTVVFQNPDSPISSIVLRSRAVGTVTIANVIQEYTS